MITSMIISMILGALTALFVALHALIVYGGYMHVFKRSGLQTGEKVILSMVAASGLLHIINYVQ